MQSILLALLGLALVSASYYFTWIHNGWAAVGFFMAATIHNILVTRLKGNGREDN